MSTFSIVCLFFFFAILFAGIATILYTLVPNEGRKASAAMGAFARGNKDAFTGLNTSGIDSLLAGLIPKIAARVHLTPIQKAEMASALYISGEKRTPEEYTAYQLALSAMFSLLSLPFFLMSLLVPQMKYLGFITIIFSAVYYFVQKRKLKSTKKKHIANFEMELPRFVAYLKQAFRSNSDVQDVISKYSCTNELFLSELQKTIADARTSSMPTALGRLDERVASNRMTMVVRGLLSAYNGDDTTAYFEMLERDFSSFEVAELKKQVGKLPGKMTLSEMLILFMSIIILFYPIIMQIIESFQQVSGIQTGRG